MFKDEFPATYRAVMAHLSRQRQAVANDSQPDDNPQAGPLPVTSDEPVLADTPIGDAGVPSSAIFISLSVRSPVHADLSISIDIFETTAASEITAAAPALCDQQLRATVAIGGAP